MALLAASLARSPSWRVIKCDARDLWPGTYGAFPESAPVEKVTLPPEPQATLSNRDVLYLSKAGFGEAVILAKIRSSKCDFDTSVDALMELKAAGLSEPVILAMMETTEAVATKAGSAAPD